MTDLESVQEFRVSKDLLAAVQVLFEARGADGMELVAYLAGKIADQHLLVDTLAIPKQTGLPVEFGCSLHIPGSEFTRIGTQLRDRDRIYCGGIHSHPDEAFHSAADDRSPTMRFAGALSIVVPDFGARGTLTKKTAVFRFDGVRHRWRPLSQSAWRRMLREVEAPVTILGPE